MSIVRSLGALPACLLVQMVSGGWLPAMLLGGGGVLVYRLLAEGRRRKTLVELVKVAPAETLVVQEEGMNGPAMLLWVGSGSGRPMHPPRLVVHVHEEGSGE